MKPTLVILAGLLLTLATPDAAFAESTTTYTDSYTDLATGTGVSETFVLPGFDPSLGILTSVVIEYTAGITNLRRYENESLVPGSGFVYKMEIYKAGLGLVPLGGDPSTYGSGLDWVSEGLDATVWDSTHFLDYEVGEITPFGALPRPNTYDGVTDFGGTSGFTQFTDVISHHTLTSLTDAADLAFFTTSGTVELKDFTTVMEAYSTVGGLSKGSSGSWRSGEVSTTYFYTPVPEVSSVFLTGMTGAMVLLRRRRGHA
ncbi:MAG: proteinsorting protein [Verrucomicrobiales bacterium]|nr:proteinsorting protein [Verrucomicrobiales bacterium]